MGCGTWSASSWSGFAASTASRATTGSGGVFARDSMKDELNPKNIAKREAMDSVDHPNSTPIIVGLDVTGSMSRVLRSVIDNLNTFVENIYSRNIVPDPQVCFMGIGDADFDRAPLQVTQFESDIRIAESLRDIWLEQAGGGNDFESYTLPWFFAQNHVYADAIEKRGKKGYLFTMGDECCPARITKAQIKKVFGYDIEEADIPTEDLLAQVSQNWEVYHLVITEGNFYSGRYRDHDGPQKIKNTWGKYLEERCIYVTDMTKIPEILVSILQVDNGADVAGVLDSWDGSTRMVVRDAISGLTEKKNTTTEAVVNF